MRTQTINYADNSIALEGYVAYPDKIPNQCPIVLINHDWSGRNEFADHKAQQIAKLGYIGFAVDMYGQGKIGANNEEKTQLMQPFSANRKLTVQRLTAAYNTIKTIEHADINRVAAIGFCFGGMCVLDFARSGADIRGVVSFHGFFNPPNNFKTRAIKAKVLALHGYDDPMALAETFPAFAKEMTAAGADWQVHFYGNTMHAFTNPLANDKALGTMYNPIADQRSWTSLKNFLAEVFN